MAQKDDTMTTDQTASDADSASEDQETESSAEAPMAEPIDQGPALRAGGTLNIGICHFCDDGKPAEVLASRSDGTGWIAVCEEHTTNAEEQGYTIEEQSKKSEDSKDSGGSKDSGDSKTSDD